MYDGERVAQMNGNVPTAAEMYSYVVKIVCFKLCDLTTIKILKLKY